jgi:protein-L-isoaspartate O-methyltransferase
MRPDHPRGSPADAEFGFRQKGPIERNILVMAPKSPRWRTVLLILGSVTVILATGLAAGRMLQSYDENIGFARESNRIAEVLGVRPGMTVGDMRAGLGRWTVDLARRVGDNGLVYATAGRRMPVHDLFETVAASQVENVTVITRTPGQDAWLPDDCCDAILLRHVYDAFEDRPAAAARLLQSLKPGGRLAVITRIDSTSPGMPTDRVTPRQAIDELKGAGFEMVQSIEDWSATSFCIVVRRPSDPALLTK